MGIEQLTFVWSCRQLGRLVILSSCECNNLYGANRAQITYANSNFSNKFLYNLALKL